VLTIKNTFISMEQDHGGQRLSSSAEVGARQRGSSLPRSFKAKQADEWCGLPPRQRSHTMAMPSLEVSRVPTAQQAEQEAQEPKKLAASGRGALAASRLVDTQSKDGSTDLEEGCRTPSTFGSRSPVSSPRCSVRDASFAGSQECAEFCGFHTGFATEPVSDPSPERSAVPSPRERATSGVAAPFSVDDQTRRLAVQSALSHSSAWTSVGFCQAEASADTSWHLPPASPRSTKQSATCQVDQPCAGGQHGAAADRPAPSAPPGKWCVPVVFMVPASLSEVVASTPDRQSACQAPPPGSWQPLPEVVQPQPVVSIGDVAERVRASLVAAGSIVKCVEASEGSRGWTVTAYVEPEALKRYRLHLASVAQQALMHAADSSDRVFVLGFASNPFSPMPMGFGAGLAEMEDQASACWGTYAHGFCECPSTCKKEHPRQRVGIHVMLKPARRNS